MPWDDDIAWLPNAFPPTRGYTAAKPRLIATDYSDHKPDEWTLKGEQTMYTAAGYRQVTYSVHYQTVGMPYRIEWWGTK